MLWDFNAILWDLCAMLWWEIEMKGFNDMACYGMFCYAMEFEKKRPHTDEFQTFRSKKKP